MASDHHLTEDERKHFCREILSFASRQTDSPGQTRSLRGGAGGAFKNLTSENPLRAEAELAHGVLVVSGVGVAIQRFSARSVLVTTSVLFIPTPPASLLVTTSVFCI